MRRLAHAGICLAVAWAGVVLFRYAMADFYAAIGTDKYGSHDYGAAVLYYSRSLRYAASDAEYHTRHGDALYAQAEGLSDAGAVLDILLRAKESFQKAAALNPLEGNSWMGLGRTCWWLSQFNGHEQEGKEVETAFLKGAEIDPNNGKFLYALINYYLSSAKPTESIPWLKRLAAVYPNALESLRKHPGWSDALLDPFKEGLASALDNFLVDDEALSLLASLSAQAKDWNAAAAYMEESIRRSGSKVPPSLYMTLGRYQLLAGRQADAQKSLLEGVMLSRERIKTLSDLMGVCRQVDALDLFMDLARQTAGADTAVRASLPLILGRASVLKNDLSGAEEFFHQAVRQMETAEAHIALAELAMKRKGWGKAELESYRAAQLDPRNSHAHYLLAQALQAQKRYAAAIEEMDLAIRHARLPNKEHYLSLQGDLYWAIENYGAALRSWKSAAEIAPRNASYQRRMAQAYKMLEDYGAAERCYLRAVELKPDDEGLRKELKAIQALPRPGTDPYQASTAR